MGFPGILCPTQCVLNNGDPLNLPEDLHWAPEGKKKANRCAQVYPYSRVRSPRKIAAV